MAETEEVLREGETAAEKIRQDGAEKKARRKKLAGFGVRLLCFAMITILLLTYAN